MFHGHMKQQGLQLRLDIYLDMDNVWYELKSVMKLQAGMINLYTAVMSPLPAYVIILTF